MGLVAGVPPPRRDLGPETGKGHRTSYWGTPVDRQTDDLFVIQKQLILDGNDLNLYENIFCLLIQERIKISKQI